MLERISRFLKGWRELTRALEGTLVDNLAATTPWLAPVIPAYLAYRNMVDVLGFASWVALVGALTVEFLGLATVSTVFMLWDYNSQAGEGRRAPVMAALLTAGGYIVIVLTVNVLLDESGVVDKVAQGLLSLLSVVAAVTLAVRAGHARRVLEAEEVREREREERERARQERRERRKEKGGSGSGTGGSGSGRRGGMMPVFERYTRPEVVERAREILAERSGISGSELGRLLGKSDSLGRKLKREITAEMGGNGKEREV